MTSPFLRLHKKQTEGKRQLSSGSDPNPEEVNPMTQPDACVARTLTVEAMLVAAAPFLCSKGSLWTQNVVQGSRRISRDHQSYQSFDEAVILSARVMYKGGGVADIAIEFLGTTPRDYA